MKKTNQKIKCSVESCKHNSHNNNVCQLSEIKVGCGCCHPNCKEDTVCDSFEEIKE